VNAFEEEELYQINNSKKQTIKNKTIHGGNKK